MWRSLAVRILKYRYLWLTILAILSGYMGWQASNVKLSYEFAKAIPTDNPKYLAYQEFRKKFGEDGNLLVIGIQTNNLFSKALFNNYSGLYRSLKKVKGVNEIISVPSAINLVRSPDSEKLQTVQLFKDSILTQEQIDTASKEFLNLPFYRGLLYNPATGAWLMGVSINSSILNSSERITVVNNIMQLANGF